MKAWRTTALVALIAALIGASLYLALDGYFDSNGEAGVSTEGATPTAASEAEPRVAREEDDELELPRRGTPIVWVRQGKKVDIHSSPGGPVVERVGDETQWGSHTVLSVAKTNGEWAAAPTPYTGNDGLGWVRLDPSVLKAGYTTHAIEVDLSEHRARLIRDGETIRTFTVTVGAPGAETPAGEFAVTDTFRGDLNPAYGCCAVAITAVQPKLPSGWIGGDRIALHGTTGPLGVNVSNGCVRAADRDVSALVDHVPPGAPVTVRE